MGKKGNWFVSVKKAFSPESKEKKKEKKANKLKKKYGVALGFDEIPSSSTVETVNRPPPPQPEEVKLAEVEYQQSKHAHSVAIASAAAAVAAAHVAAEVVHLTSVARYPGKSTEEVSAIKIQTAFRGFLARRALRALRGLDRLKTLIHGQSVKRQATTTLRCMQTLARVQSQIRARRIRMLEENQALQRQLQLKCEKELESLSMGDEWDDSSQSKEQVEANLLSKHDAAMRRERALAYAYSHQQMSKNSSRSANPMFMDPNNPRWGWSWLERWMAARPWESRSTAEREVNDQASVKSTSRSVGGEINKAYAHRDLNGEKPSPSGKKPSRQSPSTPLSRATSLASVAGKIKSASPRGGGMWAQDDDSRSMISMQSERYRRHSIAGSSARDDESLASSPSVPSYMAPTQSAKAKARLQSPLGFEKIETPDRGLAGSVKKRLSFPASPAAPRRHSGPPKIDSTTFKDLGLQAEAVSNGGSR